MAGGLNGPPILTGSAYIHPSTSLANLRDDLLTLLGFPDSLTLPDSETNTLVSLRESVIRRCGFTYVVGANAPGQDDLVDSFINEAQQTIFRTVEFDKSGVSYPSKMTDDAHVTGIDYIPVLMLSIGLAKAHYRQPDSTNYFEQFSKYLSDRAVRRPPKVVGLCTQWLILAQKKLYRRYKMLRTELWWNIPITQGNRIYDIPAIHSDVLTDLVFVNGGPATITRAAGSWLTDGFIPGYRIKALGASQANNNNVQWTLDGVTALVLTLDADDTVVAESAGASVVINTMNYVNLDFRQASEAWLLDGSTWLRLKGGIDAAQFTISTQTTPTRYEFRKFFEIFPEPQKDFTAYIKGHMGLMSFSGDNDVTTIDAELILLQALIWGKQHFNQPDAREFKKELDGWIGALNSGTFAGLRFVPRETGLELQSLPYPQVTFDRD